MPGYSLDKDDHRRRLARIEGQVRGIQRMIDEDAYCIDVLTQIASVTKALQGVALGLLDQHIAHCVVSAAERSEEEGAAKVEEAVRAVERLLRT
jgi:DNA-binding FrmR family transcriptional regulator